LVRLFAAGFVAFGGQCKCICAAQWVGLLCGQLQAVCAEVGGNRELLGA